MPALWLARQARWQRPRTQPTTEVVALHAAVCFGDRTVAARLTNSRCRRRAPGTGCRTARRRAGSKRTAKRCSPSPRHGSRWERCSWPPTPPRTPSPRSPDRAGRAPWGATAAPTASRRPVVLAPDTGAGRDQRAADAHGAGARDRLPGRERVVEPGDRRSPGHLGPHGGEPRVPGERQARRGRSQPARRRCWADLRVGATHPRPVETRCCVHDASSWPTVRSRPAIGRCGPSVTTTRSSPRSSPSSAPSSWKPARCAPVSASWTSRRAPATPPSRRRWRAPR